MTAQQADAAKSDGAYLARVEVFMVTAAVNVIAEAGTTANHGARVTLAQRILGATEVYTPRFALASMSNATLLAANSLAEILDGDLQFTINSLFTTFLGV